MGSRTPRPGILFRTGTKSQCTLSARAAAELRKPNARCLAGFYPFFVQMQAERVVRESLCATSQAGGVHPQALAVPPVLDRATRPLLRRGPDFSSERGSGSTRCRAVSQRATGSQPRCRCMRGNLPLDPRRRARGLLGGVWRRRPDLNRRWRFCRPLPYHLATAPTTTQIWLRDRSNSGRKLERETGFEPATSTLARSHSTTELFPLNSPEGNTGLQAQASRVAARTT
jgi:hypothetical protein